MLEEIKKPPRYIFGLRGNALLIGLTDFVIDCGMFLTNAFWSLYVLALGASIIEFGIYSIITSIFPAFFIAPLGYLADRMSKRKLVIISGFLSVIGPLWHALANDWIGLIPGALIGSIVVITRPARQALIAEDISPSERGGAFSTIFTLTMLPDTFMPIIAGLFLDRTDFIAGMRILLLVNAFLRLIVAVVRLRLLKESSTPFTVSGNPRGTFSFKHFASEMIKPVLKIKTLRVMLIGGALSSFAMGLSGRYQSVFVVDVVGLSKTDWGLITALAGVFRVLTRIPFGRFSDNWGRRRSILINYALQPPALLAFALARDFNGFLFARVAQILAFNFGTSAWEAMLVDITPANMLGSLYGTMGMMDTTMMSISAIPGSFVWDYIGPEWVFYLGTVARVFSFGYLYLYLREPKDTEK